MKRMEFVCGVVNIMSNSAENQAHALGNQVVGKAKEVIGQLTSNPQTHAEGTLQEVKGQAQEAISHAAKVGEDVKETVQDVAQEAQKNVTNTFDSTKRTIQKKTARGLSREEIIGLLGSSGFILGALVGLTIGFFLSRRRA